MPRGQILFGLLFLAFVAALAWLRVKAEASPSAKQILAPAAPATPAPAAPPKH
jgi:hypothetical protein